MGAGVFVGVGAGVLVAVGAVVFVGAGGVKGSSPPSIIMGVNLSIGVKMIIGDNLITRGVLVAVGGGVAVEVGTGVAVLVGVGVFVFVAVTVGGGMRWKNTETLPSVGSGVSLRSTTRSFKSM